MVDTETGKDKHTFNIGLVLAGAVSAGAYSAGVIDFLIEAIDRWYDAKESESSRGIPPEQWQVPTHNICIRTISGSSAGSMVAALTAVALSEPPAAINPAQLPEKNDKTNKLYSSWVVEADIASMLTTSDLKEKTTPLTSLLDSSFLIKLAEETMIITKPSQSRAYVADHLALFICVTNLRGVPYSIDFRGSKVIEHGMSNHSDYIKFDLVKPESRDNIDLDASIILHPNPQDEKGKAAWNRLAQAVVASGAFPLALAPRIIQRQATDYDERRWIIPSVEPKIEATGPVCSTREKIPPAWDGDAPANYSFVAVDGGVMNNEPLEYARQEIAGDLQRNKRSGHEATRAVVMIDPFPDSVSVNANYETDTGIPGVVSAIFKSLMSQAKFKVDELKLARDPSVFSRFIIAPTREKTEPEGHKGVWAALASNCLLHFGGFLNEEFRRHDFLLGRRNCQRFLQKYFVLPAGNPLFERWPVSLKQAGSPYLRKLTVEGKETDCLPIIPLIGDLADEIREPQQPWPMMPKTELDTLRKGLGIRTGLVVKRLVSGLIGPGGSLTSTTKGWKSVSLQIGLFLLKPLIWLLKGWLTKRLTAMMMKKINENLAAADLIKDE